MRMWEIDPNEEFEKVESFLADYVIERDNKLCQLCSKEGHHIHHLVFRSQTGKHKANNLVLLCYKCHDNLHHGEVNRQEVFVKLQTRIELNEKLLRKRI